MARSYSYEDGRSGRRKIKVDREPPKGFKLHVGLMKKLDVRGWYSQLGERLKLEQMDGDPRDYEVDGRLKRMVDPVEIDRIMCRTDVVAEVVTQQDLEIARVNGRIVLEIDPACPNDVLFKKIQDVLKKVQNRRPRRVNTAAWAKHRILALYDLKLTGYDLVKERKQLAVWLFPELANGKARGDKYDRARELLERALASLDVLRAQSGR